MFCNLVADPPTKCTRRKVFESGVPECCDDAERFISLGEKGTFSTIRTAKDIMLPTKVTGTLKSRAVLSQAQIAATPASVEIACTV